MIDQALTTPLGELRSTGSHVIWSSGDGVGRTAEAAPDLYISEPGGTPQVVYDNPNRGSTLQYIDGVGTQLAFMETNNEKFGFGNWKLWYLPAIGESPREVDAGGGSQLPFFSISTEYLVWNAIEDETNNSQLLVLNLQTMGQRQLGEAQPDSLQYWFPDVDGSRVVFGTVEPNADFSGDERHVYLIDLVGDGEPLKLDRSTSASEPAIDGDTVVWKDSDPDSNFLNAGSLVRYSIATGTEKPLEIPTPEGLGFVDPTVGDRFVAAWAQSDRTLYVADLETGQYPAILDLGETSEDPHDSVARADIEGDLLVYSFGPADGDLEARWVLLE